MVRYVQEHPIRVGVIVVAGAVLGVVVFLASRFWFTFEAVATEDFNPRAAAQALEERTPEEVAAMTESQRRQFDEAARQDLATLELEEEMAQRIAEMKTTEYRNPAAISPALPDEMFEAYLGVGSDASGVLADTILLALAPTDGGAPILVSIPRDLYVRNPCHEGWSRINAALGSCEGLGCHPRIEIFGGDCFEGKPEPGCEKYHDSKHGPRYDDHTDANGMFLYVTNQWCLRCEGRMLRRLAAFR